ncbi:hypothetical protein JCM8202_004861 [Rhodotorula sphaerocarpa]
MSKATSGQRRQPRPPSEAKESPPPQVPAGRDGGVIAAHPSRPNTEDLQGHEAVPAHSSDSDLTYADPVPPGPPAQPVGVRNILHETLREGPPADVGIESANMTLDAWVSADHSLTADSRSLSLARVEDWRAMVDASQEQENPVEYDMEATPKPAKGRLRRGKGTEISSPEPARPPTRAERPADRSRSHTTPKAPLRIPRRTKELQAADPKSARADPSCKDPPSAGPRRKGSAEPDGSLRSDRRFGRERTNETASTASAGEEEDKRPGAKAKATRASRGEAGQAGRAGRAKRAVALEVGSDSEGDREARKEQARAKWQAIDDYALDTVYTL